MTDKIKVSFFLSGPAMATDAAMSALEIGKSADPIIDALESTEELIITDELIKGHPRLRDFLTALALEQMSTNLNV